METLKTVLYIPQLIMLFCEESVTALEAINICLEENYPEKARNIGAKIKNNLTNLKK